QNALVDATGNPLVTPLTFTFSTGTFGISKPAQGTDVLENSTIVLEVRAGNSLNVATVVFSVNGQALPAVGPPFSTTFSVGSAASTPTLTILATARNASGSTVAQDQVIVPVTTGLAVRTRLLGVPLAGSARLRLFIPGPLPTDLSVQLAAVDASIALPTATALIAAGQTETAVDVAGLATGATTIVATSTRGNTWAIASVSAPVSKTLAADAASPLVAVTTGRSLGRALFSSNQQQTATLTLLSTAAAADTLVTISSTSPNVATVTSVVSITAGSRAATVPIVTGASGTAVLTLRAGVETSQLTVVVGPPFADVPLVIAPAAGVVVSPTASSFIGRIFSPTVGLQTVGIRLLSSPAQASTPVSVATSDPAIANVLGTITVATGSDSANVSIQTGSAGVATLTFRAGTDTRQLTVVVGTPPAGMIPPVFTSPVGVVVLQSASTALGRVFTGVAGQSSIGVRLVSAAVVSDPAVAVTKSNANVISVVGPVTIPAGTRSATVNLAAGVQGVATLTFVAAGETRQLTVVVGTPPPGTVPLVVSTPVGVALLPVPQVGRMYSALGSPPSLAV